MAKEEKTLMRISTIIPAALVLCAVARSQPISKPEVDWATIDKQLEALRTSIHARDIGATQNISQELWYLPTQEKSKQSPTAEERLALAERQRPAGSSTSLPYLATQAFQAGQLEKAELYARQTLQTPSQTYDSIHIGNIVLGLVALKRDGDIDAAKASLLAAANTKGTGTLDRWGPNLALAKALLDKGQNEVVLEYLQACKSFVTKNPKPDDWIAILKGGRAPDLSHEYLWYQ
jgi:hypothetical protein